MQLPLFAYLPTLLVGAALSAGVVLGQSLSVVKKADNTFWAEVQAPAGASYTLQASTNLHLWIDVRSEVPEQHSRPLTNRWHSTEYFRLVPTPAEAPPIRILIIGDSLSSDCCGWGGGIYRYFKPNATVVNYALPLTSTKVFLQSSEYEKMLLIRPNYVLMQFAWFDGSDDPDRSTTPEQFAQNLRTLVQTIRGFNGVPVLITMHAPRTWDPTGKLIPYHHPLNAVTKQVSEELKTPFIDLYQLSSDLLKKLGASGSEFMHYEPFGPYDVTHLSLLGAVWVSQLVVNNLPDDVGPYMTGILDAPPNP